MTTPKTSHAYDTLPSIAELLSRLTPAPEEKAPRMIKYLALPASYVLESALWVLSSKYWAANHHWVFHVGFVLNALIYLALFVQILYELFDSYRAISRNPFIDRADRLDKKITCENQLIQDLTGVPEYDLNAARKRVEFEIRLEDKSDILGVSVPVVGIISTYIIGKAYITAVQGSPSTTAIQGLPSTAHSSSAATNVTPKINTFPLLMTSLLIGLVAGAVMLLNFQKRLRRIAYVLKCARKESIRLSQLGSLSR